MAGTGVRDGGAGEVCEVDGYIQQCECGIPRSGVGGVRIGSAGGAESGAGEQGEYDNGDEWNVVGSVDRWGDDGVYGEQRVWVYAVDRGGRSAGFNDAGFEGIAHDQFDEHAAVGSGWSVLSV